MGRNQSNKSAMLPTQMGNRNRDGSQNYFALSSKPWHTLLFLLPFIVIFELGSTGFFGDGVTTKLEAQDLLVRFFDLFGTLGLHIPAVALVVVLFIQHLLSKESWNFNPMILLAMIAESAFLTGPLIILVIILQPVVPELMIQANEVVTGSVVTESNQFQESFFLALGAGLYEEMLFRLVMITMLHFIIADVLSFKDQHAKIFAVLLSAIAFAWLHHEVYTPGVGLNIRVGLFYLLAGVYFGILFLSRGLGIAVGAHLMYDLLALVIMPGFQTMASSD